MDKKTETYPNQFCEWVDGCFVAGDIYDEPTSAECEAAIVANFAVSEMVGESDD